MANLRDRVKCATATVGQGQIALGAASPGYRTFDSAYAADRLISYVIEDGAAWETGVGTFSKAGNSLDRQMDASSTGGLLNLTGNATVAVAFLSREHVPDWPVLVVARSAGEGTSQFQNIGSAFTTVAFATAASVDSHGGWSIANNTYTIPQTGTYQMVAKARLTDGNKAGKSYGIGIDIANQDSAGFQWCIGNSNRQGGMNIRQMQLVAGDAIRMFMYIDGGGDNLNGAELVITRVR